MRRASGRGPRAFDPVKVGHLEAQAWASYYRHDWVRFLRAAVGMVGEGFQLGPVQTVRGAWHVLAANRAWAPYPDNDPDAAREQMRRFYELARRHGGLELDPRRAAHLEVEWWRRHREHQYAGDDDGSPLVASLVDLYSYVYGAEPAAMLEAARWRVTAMDVSDAWVAAGRHLDDPLLAQERRALVASYSALRAAVEAPAAK